MSWLDPEKRLTEKTLQDVTIELCVDNLTLGDAFTNHKPLNIP